jgi:hypothetical protein
MSWQKICNKHISQVASFSTWFINNFFKTCKETPYKRKTTIIKISKCICSSCLFQMLTFWISSYLFWLWSFQVPWSHRFFEVWILVHPQKEDGKRRKIIWEEEDDNNDQRKKLCSLRCLVKGTAMHSAKSVINMIWLAHHDDCSKWFAISSLSPIWCLPFNFICRVAEK